MSRVRGGQDRISMLAPKATLTITRRRKFHEDLKMQEVYLWITTTLDVNAGSPIFSRKFTIRSDCIGPGYMTPEEFEQAELASVA